MREYASEARASRRIRWLPLPFAAILGGLVLIGVAGAEELPDPPAGPAPWVEAYEDQWALPPLGLEAEEERLLVPDHPPISQIPPMPMPGDRPIDYRITADRSGHAVAYDAETGETTEFPGVQLQGLVDEFRFGGGYSGADGGEAVENRLDTFTGDMTVVSAVGNSPWRMNAKLVMRFGTDWYVCSGTMRDAEVVLTAGHCVYDYGGYGWANQIWVYPGWEGEDFDWNDLPPNDTVGAYGRGYSTAFNSWNGWTNSGDLNYDLGLVRITRAVGVLTGWFSWSYGGDCAYHTAKTYNNASYPAEGCGQPGLHNGLDMYYWYGGFDSCPSWNRLQVDTSGGCFNAVWGGMSGSGAYWIDGDSRYVHGVCSTSNRSTYGRYARQFEAWVNHTNNTFIPGARGAVFDLQALDMNVTPTTIQAGTSTTVLNHLAANPTNGTDSDTYSYGVYLSTNSTISTGDTLLSSQFYPFSFGAMSSVRVNMVQVTLPTNTAAGTYWLGVVYNAATDGVSGNNDSSGWDAARITVTACPNVSTPGSITYPAVDCDGALDVSWSAVAGVSSYTLQRATNGSFTDAVTVYTGSGTSYAQSGLANGTYYYRVKAGNACGKESGWRAGSALNVTTTPAASASITYPDLDCDGTFTVSWAAADRATSYTLQRATNAKFSGAVAVYSGPNTSYPESGLPPGTYYYRVRAENDCGASSWRAGTAMDRGDLPPAPTGLAYPAVDCDGTYSVTWNAVGRSASYILQRATDPGFADAGAVYNGPNTSYEESGLPAGTYYYRVLAVGVCGESPWTSGGAMNRRVTPAAPAGLSYPERDPDGSFTVTWGAVSGATAYRLERATNPAFADAAAVYLGASLLYDEMGLAPGTYYYRVRAENDCGNSSWAAGPAVQVGDGSYYAIPSSQSGKGAVIYLE